MKRASWMSFALSGLAFVLLAGAAGEARAQWAEVSTVRYGLLGRPRAVETHFVPSVGVLPSTSVLSTGTVIGSPIVETRYLSGSTVLPTRSVLVDPYVVPTTIVTRPAPIVETRVLSPVPVVRSYAVPTTVRVLEPSVLILP